MLGKKSLIDSLAKDIIAFIEHQQELMFNERDFQMQLAVALRASRRYDDVDVEYFIPNSFATTRGYEWDSDLRLDIVARRGEQFAVVELKYPTRRIITDIRRFDTLLPGVEIVKNHGAQDIVSYNFWKDVRRIEIIKALFPGHVVGGIAVMLTNDPYYTRGARKGSICDAFSTADGRTGVHGPLTWLRNTPTANAHPAFTLSGNYSVEWHPTTIDSYPFYFTLINV